MIALSLALALVAQDTTALSPRARGMLGSFPPPRTGDVSVATRFSTDTAWLGEQVELVTAAWFPRELRDRLRRPPTLRSPSLSGLWSVQSQSTPSLASSRFVGGQVYDLFVAHQTLFPLGEGTIQAPPATLSFAVPASVSYFAPENRRTLSSRSVTLVVRPIPANLAGPLAGGPTARSLALTWRAPVEGLATGTPALVELVITGEGNITLWPVPIISWPAGVRVYTERTDERATMAGGRIGGEKRFRFTVVADSEGVVTLPRVRYPFFDPSQVAVRVASAAPLSLPVLTGGATDTRRAPPVYAAGGVPFATRLVRDWWPALALLVLLPLALHRSSRRRVRGAAPPVPRDAEAELRRLLGTPVDAAPERVAGALRRRGIGRGDAEDLRGWLAAGARRRYGPGVAPDAMLAPPVLDRVVAMLRRALKWSIVLAPIATIGAQGTSAADRYRARDFAGATRAFESALVAAPRDPVLWHNLAAARMMSGDDVGAAAAVVRSLELAPRDAATRRMWNAGSAAPPDVRLLAPRLPASRDEILLVALLLWLTANVAWHRRRRQLAMVAMTLCITGVAIAALRWHTETSDRALVRAGARLHVSPHPAAPVIGDVATWSLASLERRTTGWWLVSVPDGRRGWLADGVLAPLGGDAR